MRADAQSVRRKSAGELLRAVEHRPYALPRGPWIMKQVWHDLLFAHWEVDAAALRRLIPDALPLDLWRDPQDGRERAFLAIVPFRMSGIRPRLLPPAPWLSAFPELNVRAYVIRDGRPGVYFFSLEAANWLAVAIARAWFHLPYFNARMQFEREAAPRNAIRYSSHRIHGGAPDADFAGSYGPAGPIELAQPGSLEHWLTERYCLYTTDGRGRVIRGEIHHAPWPLQPAFARIDVNSMARAAGLDLFPPGEAPLLHFAERLDVLVWRPERLAAP